MAESPLFTMPRLSRSLPPIYAVGAVRLLMPLLVLPLVAARLGPEGFGRLSFILVWSGLLGMLVEGGFLAAATRVAVAADASARWRLAQQVFTARCLLCVPTVLLAVAAVHATGHGVSTGVTAVGAATAAGASVAAGGGAGNGDAIAIAALACAIGWPATWYLQATQQLGRWARTELVVYATLLVLTWAFADGVMVYVALQFAALTLLAVLGWQRLRHDLAAARGPDAQRAGLWSANQLVPGLRLGWTMLPVSVAGAAYSFALPAAASSQLPKADLGIYFMADRIVRALVAAADPVFSVIYPRIVALFAFGARAALRYAARWALAGAIAGAAILLAMRLLLPIATPWLAPRATALDLVALQPVLYTLGALLPLLLGWKFFGYWLLGSHRFDAAYRSSIVVGGIVGTASALTFGGAAGAVGLAWTAIGVELLVIVVAVGGSVLTLRRR